MRYFFQWMILITMALSLVACSGSSGSDGATGAAGAQGDKGDPGSIAVPDADSDLAITASTTVDSDITLGQVARTFTLSGTDNLTADNRTRYYIYFGKSSSSKDAIAVSGNSAANSVNQTMPLDTRLKASDNYTLTLTADRNLGDGDGSITHLIVCPGNEAGDATSCASAAIDDRGSAATVTGAAGDNATTINFVNGLTVVRASGGNNIDVDTLTVPSTKDATVVDSGTLKAGTLTTASQAPGVIQFGITDTYIIGVGDNSTSMSVYDHTASTLSAGKTNHVAAITDVTVSEGSSGATYAVLQNGADNVSVWSVSSGSLAIFNDNASTHGINSVHHCSAANPNGSEVVTGHFFDNATAGLILTKWSTSAVSAAIITANDSGDNGTFGTSCAAAWAADGSASGKLYIASADNATGYEVCISTDNGSSCGSTIKGSQGGAGAGGHLAITTDPETYQPIVAFNKAGTIYVDRYDNSSSSWETLINSGSIAHATADTVSVTTSGNDHIIVATQGATADNSSVILFYDK